MELGTTYRYKRSGAKRSLVEKSETFQYVPLIENLQWLLQNMDVYQEVGGCTLWSQNLSIYMKTVHLIYSCYRYLKSMHATVLRISMTIVMEKFIKNIHCF